MSVVSFFLQKRRLLFHFGGSKLPGFYDCFLRLLSSFILFSPLAQKANSLPNQMYKPPTQNLEEKDIPYNSGDIFQRPVAVHGFTGLQNTPCVTWLNIGLSLPGLPCVLNKVIDMEKQLLLHGVHFIIPKQFIILKSKRW